MKKNQVNAILVDQTKRKSTIIAYIFMIVIIFLSFILFLFMYLGNNKSYTVSYKEDSNIDYKVYLKENNFFGEQYLDSNNNYIASLIDYIKANFKYTITMEEKEVEYNYSYRIESTVSVKERNNKPLYTNTKKILSVNNQYANSNTNVEINESLNIDYNEYNDLIKNFVSIYGLDDIDSTLTISMYIDTIGSCDKFEEDSNNETVMSLVIPLTTKTVGIDIKNNIIESNDNVIICNESNSLIVLYLIISILFLLLGVFVVYKLIRYVITTRTAETIYDIELKKILNNYHSYIQKVSNSFDLNHSGLEIDDNFIYSGCQFFKLEAFTDLLEIRDSINAPILMSSNKKNTATYFVILDVVNRAVYVYGIKVTDIKKQMKNNAIEKGYIDFEEKDEQD